MKKKYTLILVAMAVIFLLALNTTSDKKESSFEWGRTLIGGGAMGFAALLPSIVGGALPFSLVIGLFLGGMVIFFPGLVGILTPDKGIPSWIWILGVVVILFMLVRKKD